jgi:hypothetical protein
MIRLADPMVSRGQNRPHPVPALAFGRAAMDENQDCRFFSSRSVLSRNRTESDAQDPNSVAASRELTLRAK